MKDVRLKVYLLKSEEGIFSTIQSVLHDQPDILIGEILTTEIAANQGIKTILLSSGEDSLRNAFLQAERVSFARQLEKERMRRFRVMVDYSVQGIISIDRNKRIEFMNVAAENMTGISLSQVKGSSLAALYPDIPLDACLQDGKVYRGQFVQLHGQKFMANIIPTDIDGGIIGAMITLEDVGHILEMEATIRKKLYTKGLLAQYYFDDIIGISPQIAEVKQMAENYAYIDATVIISGASGTGKKLFAQSIHNASQRHKRSFVVVNCGAISSSILESELFGYVEGAFTGALPLQLPSLKDRNGDAEILAEHFINIFNKKFHQEVVLSEEAKSLINAYEWPGNIRQILNTMERIVIVAKEKLISADLIETMLDVSTGQLPKKPHLIVEKEDCSEKTKILCILEETNYNQKEASKKLGINRSTLYRKLKAYNISLKRICNV